MWKFIIGTILYAVGVFLAIKYAGVVDDSEQIMKEAKNFIYGGIGGIVIGVVLSIWGFIEATTPKPKAA